MSSERADDMLTALVAAALALPMTLTFSTFELIDRAAVRRLASVIAANPPGGCLPSTPPGHPRGHTACQQVHRIAHTTAVYGRKSSKQRELGNR